MKYHSVWAVMTAVLLLFCACAMPSVHGDIEQREVDTVILETQYPIYAPDAEQISVTIRNYTDSPIEYGAEWSLEMKRGGGWVTLPFKENVGWIGLAYGLGVGASSSFRVNTSILARPLTEGRYRIIKEIGGVAYAGEFSVGDSTITAEAPHGYLPLGALPADYSAADAEADGVIFADGAAAVDRFFAQLGVGHDVQLRLGQDAGGLVLTDILVEEINGARRIRYSVDYTRAGGGRSETYYSYFVVDNAQIALSNFVDGDEKQVVLSLPTVTETAIVTVYRMQESAKEWSVNTAGFWSPDGMKLIMLRADSAEFGLSVCYPDGGSMGITLALDAKYGITAIKEVLWGADSETVMLAGNGDGGMILVPYCISDGRFDDPYFVPND
ncbi:MAG: hypothetical protein IJC15_02115 [Clostridia bacterium]|nr:hypothetical protein [Clostridia bacterium]